MTSRIELRDRRICIDGEPRSFLSGEVHHFRLARSLRPERLQQLKNGGCNTLATYVGKRVAVRFDLSSGTLDLARMRLA